MRLLSTHVRTRLRRRLGLDRNPLRRRSDRVERVVRLAALALLVVTLPVAFWSGARSYGHGLGAMRAEQAARHQTVATLTSGAPESTVLAPGGAPASTGFVPARWLAPDGTPRAGYLRVAAGASAGTTTRIWTDEAGRPVGPPMGRARLAWTAVAVGIRLVAAVAAGILLGLTLFRLGLRRAQMRAWDAGWATVGPRWTRDRI